MRHPLVGPALSFVAGIATARAFPSTFGPVDLFGLGSLAILCLVQARLAVARIGSVVPGLLGAFFLCGLLAAALEEADRARSEVPEPPGPVLLTGRLLEDPRPRPIGPVASFLVQEVHRDAPEALVGQGVRIGLPPDVPDLRGGDRLRLWVRLREPRGYGNPGAFDLKAWLLRQGLHWTGRCKSRRLLERLDGDGAFLLRSREAVRRLSRRGLSASLPDAPEARGVLQAILLGERRAVPDELADRFSRAGIGHVLTVSGLHVGLLALLLLRGSRLVGLGREPALLCVAPVVFSYAWIAGGEAPVVRAALGATLAAAAALLYREVRVLNLVAGIGIVLLAARPSSLGDLSFRLTFEAVLGIVLLAPRLASMLEKRLPWAPDGVRTLAGCSLAAQAAILPETITTFGTVAPGAVVVNLLAVPAAALLVPLALAAGLLGVLSPVLAGPVALLARFLIDGLSAVCGLAGSASWDCPPPPAALVAVYGVLLVWIAAVEARRLAAWWAAARRVVFVAVLFFMTTHPFAPELPPEGTLRFTALDVGQGDALLVEAADDAVLVDAGGTIGASEFDVGERVVAPALRHLARRQLAALVLTHPDRDHVGGAAAVLRRLEVGVVWRPAVPWVGREWRRVRGTALRRGVPVRRLRRGDRVQAGAIGLRVLWPPAGFTAGDNDASLVLEVRHTGGPAAVLLTGDIEAPAERILVREGVAETAILKVAHHGSKSSTTPGFLRSAKPRLAVVSVGARNPWNHPHPEVMDRLRDAGVRVARTDRRGAVRVLVDRRGRVTLSPLPGGHRQ